MDGLRGAPALAPEARKMDDLRGAQPLAPEARKMDDLRGAQPLALPGVFSTRKKQESEGAPRAARAGRSGLCRGACGGQNSSPTAM